MADFVIYFSPSTLVFNCITWSYSFEYRFNTSDKCIDCSIRSKSQFDTPNEHYYSARNAPTIILWRYNMSFTSIVPHDIGSGALETSYNGYGRRLR